MAAGPESRSSSAYVSSSVILLRVVMAVLHIWLLIGDVELGALVIARSVVFGVVALAAGVLALLGGGLALLRSRRIR